MKTVPVTYATGRPSKSYFRKNAALLADKLSTIPDSRHDQFSWYKPNHTCGTTGCALGIAAMSHIIPGLQFNYIDMNARKIEGPLTDEYHDIVPTINGKSVPWHKAAYRFFGEEVYDKVFECFADKTEIIRRLRSYADTGTCVHETF